MQKLLKPVASLLAMGLFLLFAMATGGSTNTTVGVKKCDGRPSFTGELFIHVRYRTFDDQAIIAPGTMFIVHQVIEDTVDCKSLIVSQQTIPFSTDIIGTWAYTTEPFTHTYSGDLWRVEINIPPKPGQYFGFRKMYVVKYNETFMSFTVYDPPKL